MNQYICSKCKMQFQETNFSKCSNKRGRSYVCKQCVKHYYNANKERLNTYQKNRYQDNKEELREYQRNWRKLNPDLRAAQNAKRRAAQLSATPKWLTKEDNTLILQFYKEAQHLTKETGIPHEVDHIVPLLGELVRGLHVPWNLQVLTSEENGRKTNRID